jgi:hypothetical protein
MTTVNPPSETPAAEARPHWRAAPAGYLAAGWAALYGVLALVWTATGRGYPFGGNDPKGEVSLLRLIPVDVAAPLFAVLLLGTAVAALAMAGPHAVRPRGGTRRLLLAYGWLAAAVLLVVVPDIRVLIVLGYLPMLIGAAGRLRPGLRLGAGQPGARRRRRRTAGPYRADLAAGHGRALPVLRARRGRRLGLGGRGGPLGPVGGLDGGGHPGALRGDPLRLGGRHPARHPPLVPAGDAGGRRGLGRVRAGGVRGGRGGADHRPDPALG